MFRRKLKLAIVAADTRYQQLALNANRHIGPGRHLAEHDITRIVTGRKNPSPDQAAALALVLGRAAKELFPEMEVDS